MSFLLRGAAREYLRENPGLPLGDTALENMASKGIGPKYSIVHGRAVYRREDLDAWVIQQAARPVVRRRHKEQPAA
jgi:hypothetical protein